jgi:hypothetical protein
LEIVQELLSRATRHPVVVPTIASASAQKFVANTAHATWPNLGETNLNLMKLSFG